MQSLERVSQVARHLLTIPLEDGHTDMWLWERAARVAHLAQAVAGIPELAEQAVDRVALGAAGLFHCAGWLPQVREGRLGRYQVLSRPTSDVLREIAAGMLQEHAAHLLPPPSARLAVEALRESNNRATRLVEAHILVEAENLDDMGMLHVLRQFRQYQAESRPVRQLVDSWQRQHEYRYWEMRINEGLRFETTRAVARGRVRSVDVFMGALARDLEGTDLLQVLERRDGGAAAPVERAGAGSAAASGQAVT